MAKYLPFFHTPFSQSQQQSRESKNTPVQIPLVLISHHLQLHSSDLSLSSYIKSESSPTALFPAPRLFRQPVCQPAFAFSSTKSSHLTCPLIIIIISPTLMWPGRKDYTSPVFHSHLFCRPHQEQQLPSSLPPRIQD